MEIQQKIDNFFLLFFLAPQQLIAIACAIYYFYMGKTFLVVFFISIFSSILLALAIYSIFSLYKTTKWTLILSMALGCSFLIVNSSDQISSLWCITATSVIGLLLGHTRGIIALFVISFGSFAYLMGGLSSNVTVNHNGTLLLRLLFSYGLLIMFSIVIEHFRLTDLRQGIHETTTKPSIDLQDILTQLPHRHRIEDHLKESYQKFELDDCYFSIILADLDNCREINDRYGRETGDLALTKLGHLLQNELREEDLAGRWSGNQFILVLPAISQNIALTIAERIRQKAHQIKLFSHGDQVEITLSIGVCSSINSSGLDDLLTLTENCVYQAKQMGRDRIISA